MDDESLEFNKAKNYAFRLLKFRLRSEKELTFRLKKRKFSNPVIKKVITYLKEKNFLDNGVFAKTWVSSRIKKPYGFRRIRAELRQKGIDKELIFQVLSQAKQQYNEEEYIRKIVKQKLARFRNIEPRKVKQRIYSYFIRRGFSPEIVIEIINQMKPQLTEQSERKL